MATRYIVMENSSASPRYHFIRDGWSLLALAAPVLWLAWHRAWLASALVAIATIACFVLLINTLAVVPVYAVLTGLAIATALEGAVWVKDAWRVRGYQEIATIQAQSRQQAELRFALEHQDAETLATPPPLPGAPKQASSARHQPDMIFGSTALGS